MVTSEDNTKKDKELVPTCTMNTKKDMEEEIDLHDMIAEEDLKSRQKNGPFLYYSIPGVREAELSLKEVDHSEVLQAARSVTTRVGLTAPAVVKARDAMISSSDASQKRSPSTKDDASKYGSDTQVLYIPTKSEDCPPGPVLNPESCSSALDLLGSGVSEGEDMISAQPQAVSHGRMEGDLDRIRMLPSSLRNEDWDDFHPEDNHSQGGSGI